MSKTKANVIDPLTVMDELGTDALRFTLLVGSTPGNDMNLSVKKVEANRNFANKIWNAGRFILGAAEKYCPQSTENLLAHSRISGSWRVPTNSYEMQKDLFANYQFGEAGRQIYDFFWSEFADWYIEIAKVQFQESPARAAQTTRMLMRILDRCLRLLHPFTPFVTEELWSFLKKVSQELGSHPEFGEEWETALMNAIWPIPETQANWEENAIQEFNRLVVEPVRILRGLMIESKIQPAEKPKAILISEE